MINHQLFVFFIRTATFAQNCVVVRWNFIEHCMQNWRHYKPGNRKETKINVSSVLQSIKSTTIKLQIKKTKWIKSRWRLIAGFIIPRMETMAFIVAMCHCDVGVINNKWMCSLKMHAFTMHTNSIAISESSHKFPYSIWYPNERWDVLKLVLHSRQNSVNFLACLFVLWWLSECEFFCGMVSLSV